MTTPTIKIRRAKERGHGNYGWLNTYHTFSFGDYHDEEHMGFRSIRVINDDTVKPGKGFSTHRHSNMEIVSYVIEGALEHKDNTGNGSVLKAGQFQRMTAGTGIAHSEFNPSNERSVHFLQIWIMPETQDLKPSYQEITPKTGEEPLTLIGSNENHPGLLTIHQDIQIYFGNMREYETVQKRIAPDRGVWIQMIRGKVKIGNDWALDQGDGAAVDNIQDLKITSLTDAEFLMFDAA